MAGQLIVTTVPEDARGVADWKHWYAYTCATHEWSTGWDLTWAVLDHDATLHAIHGGCAPIAIRTGRDGTSKPAKYAPPKPKRPKKNEVDYFGVCLYGCHGTKAHGTDMVPAQWIERHRDRTGHACQVQFIDHRRDETIRRLTVYDRPGAEQLAAF